MLKTMKASQISKAFMGTLLALMLTPAAFAEEQGQSLAEKARDPTASLTAFAIRFDSITKFHNLPGADQSQFVLQPIIPWKWGEQIHIARLTVPYVAKAPDWGLLAEQAAAGLPPNYVPTDQQKGLADMAAVDVMIFNTSWGRQGFGAAIVMPTASDPALGTEKWSIGPAYVAITKFGPVSAGFLAQWLVSVAGDKDRDDVNSFGLQPFGGYGFGDGWSVQLSDMNFNYDVKNGRWNSIPLGVRMEKLVTIGNLAARLYAEYEHNFQDNDVAAANTIRIGFVPLL